MKKKFLKGIVAVLIIVSVVFFTGFQMMTKEDMIDKYEPLFEILNYIQTNYYDQENIDFDEILNSTLEGAMEGLGDQFAWYFNSDESIENAIDTKSIYGGIGSVVTYNPEYESLEVVTPMIGSPSIKAGLKTGDIITEIDGIPVSEVGYYDSVNMLRGEPQTEVLLKVYREGVQDPMFITVLREEIEVKTVKYTTFEEDDVKIGYIQITQFAEPTAQEFMDALLEELGMDGYIIDLRNNPGGLLMSVLNIADFLVPEGETVITIRDKDGYEEVVKSYGSPLSRYLEDKELVVLVNGGSASASEILSGALKDHEIATIVGTTTFGKAAVQTPYNLSNGGEIWLPTAHYFTPDGSDIHIIGIVPDVTVEATDIYTGMDETMTISDAELDFENDLQLQEGIKIIIEKVKEDK